MKKILLAILFILMAVNAFAVGTVTCTTAPIFTSTSRDMFSVTCVGVGDSSAGTFPVADVYQQTGKDTSGYVLVHALTNVGPTNPNALTIKIYDGVDYSLHTTNAADYLGAAGVSISATTSARVIPQINSTTGQQGPIFVSGDTALAISGNSTGSANVVVTMYFWRP